MRVRVGIRSINCFYIKFKLISIYFHFGLVIFYICILVCFSSRNISMEKDLFCESA